MRDSTLIRGTVSGMVGGLAGTVLMYWFGAAIFVLLGWPASTSFTIIGDSAAAFFANLGVSLAGGASLGIRLYALIGLALGAVLGAATARLEPLRMASPRKKVGLSILYVEAMSLPLLAAGTLALKMSAADAVLWFGISSVMHLIYGLVLGLVTSYWVGGAILPRNVSGPNTSISPPGETIFEFHVRGQLDNRWSEWFEGLEMKLLENGEMLLFGPVVDQAALMGVLNKLSRLNLALLSVNEVKQKV